MKSIGVLKFLSKMLDMFYLKNLQIRRDYQQITRRNGLGLNTKNSKNQRLFCSVLSGTAKFIIVAMLTSQNPMLLDAYLHPKIVVQELPETTNGTLAQHQAYLGHLTVVLVTYTMTYNMMIEI